MRINEIIKTLMKEEGITQQRMALAIGKEKATDVSARLASKNMTFDKAIEMLSVMGYEITVEKKTPGAKRKGSMIVTVEDE